MDLRDSKPDLMTASQNTVSFLSSGIERDDSRAALQVSGCGIVVIAKGYRFGAGAHT
jgi:hypothetical protein